MSLLEEFINFELKMGDNLSCFVALYRSQSQTHADFFSYSQNFELTLENFSENNPYLLAATGDFNAKLRH